VTRRRKAKLAAQTGKLMLEHPTARRAATTVAVPVAKRRLRTRGRRAGAQFEGYAEAARTAGSTLAEYAPSAAQTLADYAPSAAAALGLRKPPKVKRTAPRVAIGFALGAAAMYLLDPVKGAERRARLSHSGHAADVPPPVQTTPAAPAPAPAPAPTPAAAPS
jgi:hypothetical protein